jgi:hypothetical protein
MEYIAIISKKLLKPLKIRPHANEPYRYPLSKRIMIGEVKQAFRNKY